MARPRQFLNADRQHCHAVFIALNFLGNADNHD
jgi:hypothetical protein